MLSCNTKQSRTENNHHENLTFVSSLPLTLMLSKHFHNYRTCDEMEIPEEYCICVQTWKNLSTDDQTVQMAAHLLINYINKYLTKKKVSNVCSTLIFKEVIINTLRFQTYPL